MFTFAFITKLIQLARVYQRKAVVSYHGFSLSSLAQTSISFYKSKHKTLTHSKTKKQDVETVIYYLINGGRNGVYYSWRNDYY